MVGVSGRRSPSMYLEWGISQTWSGKHRPGTLLAFWRASLIGSRPSDPALSTATFLLRKHSLYLGATPLHPLVVCLHYSLLLRRTQIVAYVVVGQQREPMNGMSRYLCDGSRCAIIEVRLGAATPSRYSPIGEMK